MNRTSTFIESKHYEKEAKYLDETAKRNGYNGLLDERLSPEGLAALAGKGYSLKAVMKTKEYITDKRGEKLVEVGTPQKRQECIKVYKRYKKGSLNRDEWITYCIKLLDPLINHKLKCVADEDQEDVRMDMYGKLIEQIDKYDPHKAAPTTFFIRFFEDTIQNYMRLNTVNIEGRRPTFLTSGLALKAIKELNPLEKYILESTFMAKKPVTYLGMRKALIENVDLKKECGLEDADITPHFIQKTFNIAKDKVLDMLNNPLRWNTLAEVVKSGYEAASNTAMIIASDRYVSKRNLTEKAVEEDNARVDEEVRKLLITCFMYLKETSDNPTFKEVREILLSFKADEKSEYDNTPASRKFEELEKINSDCYAVQLYKELMMLPYYDILDAAFRALSYIEPYLYS